MTVTRHLVCSLPQAIYGTDQTCENRSGETKTELFIFLISKQNVVWSKTSVFQSPEHTIPAVKHSSGSILLCEPFSLAGSGKMLLADWKVCGAIYMVRLRQKPFRVGERLETGAKTLQQDNGSKHRVRATTGCFRRVFYSIPQDLVSWRFWVSSCFNISETIIISKSKFRPKSN